MTWEIASPGAASKLRSSGSPSTTLAARGRFTLHFLIKTNGQQDNFVSLVVSGLLPNRTWSPCFLESRVLCFTWEIAPPGAASKLRSSGAKIPKVPQALALYQPLYSSFPYKDKRTTGQFRFFAGHFLVKANGQQDNFISLLLCSVSLQLLHGRRAF